MKNGLSKCNINGYSCSVRSLAFSSNGQFLVSGGDDGCIRVWDLSRGSLSYAFQAHSTGISSIEFGYNDQVIVSASWDKTVKIWVAEAVIPKSQKVGLFGGLFGKKMPESESLPSLPSFILQEIQEIGRETSQASSSPQTISVEASTYSFQWSTSKVPVRDPQLSLEEWNRWLKKWRREEEERKKEQRTKERLRLREERLKLERQREDRLRKEQQLRENKAKQQNTAANSSANNSSKQQKSNGDFWGGTSSGNSSGKTYVAGYRRKDGTYVKGH